MRKTRISTYKNVKSVDPEITTLWEWVQGCKNGNGFSDLCLDYRLNGDSSIKEKLPAAIVGAICEGGRKRENISEVTGWISLDIDDKQNPTHDPEELRDAIGRLREVAFAGLSVSGKGVWVLVKVKWPDRLREHFEALKSDFKWLGVNLDPSKGDNPHDLRIYSYDPDAILKEKYRIYDKLKPLKLSKGKAKNSSEQTKQLVETLISQIQLQKLDITESYENWIKVGFALADEFDENGREYFHQVSHFHPEYSQTQADEKYDSFLHTGKEGITIGTFFHICESYGITAYAGLKGHNKPLVNGIAGHHGQIQRPNTRSAVEDFKNEGFNSTTK